MLYPLAFSPFVLYSLGSAWNRNSIFHAQLYVFWLKYISVSAGLIFIKKKHFLWNPLESFFVIPLGGRSIKTIYCFNILTLSRCTDHKQNFTGYFSNTGCVHLWLTLGLLSVYLWDCFCVSDFMHLCLTEKRKKKKKSSSLVIFILAETNAVILKMKEGKIKKAANLIKSTPQDNIFKNMQSCWLDWVGSPDERTVWCHCFHNLNHFLTRSLNMKSD